MAGVWAWGWAVDAQGSTLRSEGNQQTTRHISFTGNTVSEGFSTSQTQPFGTTLRLKLGVMAWPGTLIYVTGGGAGAMVHGDFNYTGVCISGPCPLGSTPASGANTYDKFRWGYTVGGGVTFSVPGIPGGITLEYLHTDLGTVNQTILVTQPFVSPGVATTSMKTETDAVRVKFSLGL
jgi:opacity protein-like surface antigen